MKAKFDIYFVIAAVATAVVTACVNSAPNKVFLLMDEQPSWEMEKLAAAAIRHDITREARKGGLALTLDLKSMQYGKVTWSPRDGKSMCIVSYTVRAANGTAARRTDEVVYNDHQNGVKKIRHLKVERLHDADTTARQAGALRLKQLQAPPAIVRQ